MIKTNQIGKTGEIGIARCRVVATGIADLLAVGALFLG